MERFLAQVPELVDTDKRSFLYSDLSQLKLDNPEGYHEAIEFWSQFLLRLCQNGLGYSSEDRTHQHRNSSSSSGHYQSDSDNDDSKDKDILDRINGQKTGEPLRPVLCLSTKKLATRLSFRGDTPAGLDVIEEEMRKRGTLAPAAEYFSTRVRRWAGWAVGMVLPSLPGRFVASMVMGAQVPRGMDLQTLIVSSLIPDAAQRILDFHYSNVSCPQIDCLMSIREFRCRFVSVLVRRAAKRDGGKQNDQLGSAEMSVEDASILVKYLSDNRYIAVATVDTAAGNIEGDKERDARNGQAADAAFADGETTLVKFASRRAERIAASPTASSSGPISEADRGVYQVKSTRLLISRQVDRLEARISALDQQIRSALQRKQKNLAMPKLRLKRHIEENVLAKRVVALENIEKILWQLEQASSDLQMLQAFRAGTLALRGMNQRAEDMDADRVFDDWAQEAARAGEVEDALQDGSDLVLDKMPDSVSGPDVDEQLEAELDAMMAAAEPLADKAQNSETAEVLVGALKNISIAQPESPKKQQQPSSRSEQAVVAEPQEVDDSDEESKVAMPAE
ncbi:hypothetical protein IW140_003054 [Coemansia sp. RSA 1813]|nr:hypothetical protein EV179_004021 [Coemansia sp. RSA 487]KAJ2569500.1 hypothetical protein IW140_003054 [Coemansia sp. RSA 1813]